MSSLNKKVIITGATGLIGKEAIKPLKEVGFDIYAISRNGKELNTEVNWIEADLFDQRSLKKVFKEIKPEYLLNFAWKTTGDYLTSNINFDFLISSLNLLKFFNEYGGKRAVFAGTCFEYEFGDDSLNESTAKINPKITYSICKNYLHELSNLYCLNNNISFSWGRIFYVYGIGENENRLTASVIKRLSNNEEVLIECGSLLKDYMYSKDIAGAFVKLLDSQVTGSVNICTGKSISIGEYTRKIGRKLKKEHLLKFLEKKNNQPKIIVGDNNRLIKEVGYKIKYDIDEALEEVLLSN